ncbi:hypothetical protein WICMUC_000040 [Wickerhamomyces mucosus]|uniref:Uncharacterized protein n=1 Tax=Wickerhamomyces mucosus TaxID=1378264 RepID=A0A9P8PYI0_9ASCO|nr:hypothetical protein WICMUC_000040 [Wickerhamomyces mucosus]
MELRRQFTIEEEILKLVELVRSADFDSFKNKLNQYQGELSSVNNDPSLNLHLIFMDHLDPKNSDLRGKLYEDFPLADNQLTETIVNALETIDIHLNPHQLIQPVLKVVELLRNLKIFFNTAYIFPQPINFPSKKNTTYTKHSSYNTSDENFIREETITGKRAKMAIKKHQLARSTNLEKLVIPTFLINNNDTTETTGIDEQRLYHLIFQVYKKIPVIYQNFSRGFFSTQCLFINPRVLFRTNFENESYLYETLGPWLRELLNFINIITSDDGDSRRLKELKSQHLIKDFVIVHENFEACKASTKLSFKNLKRFKSGILHGPVSSSEKIKLDYLIERWIDDSVVSPIEVKFLGNLEDIFDNFTNYSRETFEELITTENSEPIIKLINDHKTIVKVLRQSMYQMIASGSKMSIITNGLTWIVMEDLENYSMEHLVPFSLSGRSDNLKVDYGLLLPNFFTLTKFSVSNVSFHSILINIILNQIEKVNKKQPVITSSVKNADLTKKSLLRSGLSSIGSADFAQYRYYVLTQVFKHYLTDDAKAMIENSFNVLDFKALHYSCLYNIARTMKLKTHHKSSHNFLEEYINIRGKILVLETSKSYVMK